MTKYAHIKDGAILRIKELTDAEISDIPEHKRAYLLPYIEVTRPAFDPSTHHPPKRLPPSIDPDGVTEAWADAVAKTAKEVDDEKEATLPPEESVQFKVLFRHENRLRALEGVEAVTPERFRTALKELL